MSSLLIRRAPGRRRRDGNLFRAVVRASEGQTPACWGLLGPLSKLCGSEQLLHSLISFCARKRLSLIVISHIPRTVFKHPRAGSWPEDPCVCGGRWRRAVAGGLWGRKDVLSHFCLFYEHNCSLVPCRITLGKIYGTFQGYFWRWTWIWLGFFFMEPCAERGWEAACLLCQSCRTLCNPMHCSPPGSSLHGTLQARRLERVAISFSRRSCPSRGWTRLSCTSCTSRWILYHWATWEAHYM